MFTPSTRGEHEHGFSTLCSMLNMKKVSASNGFTNSSSQMNKVEFLSEQSMFKMVNYHYEQDLTQVAL